MKYSKYRFLLAKLKLPPNLSNQLKESLTHVSYYNNHKNKKPGNSRLVFLGMYHFRGILAQHLEKFIPGTGQQLQHLLGNLINQKKLILLFDKLELNGLVRKDDDFNIIKHKHIFVYGLLGFFVKYVNKNQIIWFINKYIITTQDLEKLSGKKPNKLTLLTLLSQQKNGKKPIIRTKLTGDNLYLTEVIINDKQIYKKYSKSKAYSRSTAIDKALRLIVKENNYELLKNKKYETLVKEKLEKKEKNIKKKKQEKNENIIQKQIDKKLQREENKIKLKTKNQEKDRMRREKMKRRKQKMAAQQKAAREKASIVLSARKRRFLEDKQK